jgi:hypothetical protein
LRYITTSCHFISLSAVSLLQIQLSLQSLAAATALWHQQSLHFLLLYFTVSFTHITQYQTSQNVTIIWYFTVLPVLSNITVYFHFIPVQAAILLLHKTFYFDTSCCFTCSYLSITSLLVLCYQPLLASLPVVTYVTSICDVTSLPAVLHFSARFKLSTETRFQAQGSVDRHILRSGSSNSSEGSWLDAFCTWMLSERIEWIVLIHCSIMKTNVFCPLRFLFPVCYGCFLGLKRGVANIRAAKVLEKTYGTAGADSPLFGRELTECTQF